MKVNLTKKVVTETGKRYCPVVVSANGKLKPDWVTVAGQPEHHPEGTYYIDWHENGKRIRKAVSKSHLFAQRERDRKEAELAAVKRGIQVVRVEEAKQTRIAHAITFYLDEIEQTKKRKTYQAYSTTLDYFLEFCMSRQRAYVNDINREDLVRFKTFLAREKNQSPRSCANKFENTMSFLKHSGVKIELKKTDWPRYVESEVEVYEKAELDKLMAASDEQQKLWWTFLLTSGLREQEFIYLTWSDLNFEHGTVTVNWKQAYDFSPKMYKGREIPLPAKTLEMLKKARPGNGRASDLVFPTSKGNPNGHFLRTLKRLAKRAGLDESRFWLHKFRSTFATMHLAAGVDLRTVQAWMGHTDLASTLRYLKPARSEQVREKVEATFA